MAPQVCEYAETIELVTVSDYIEWHANKAATRPPPQRGLMVKCHQRNQGFRAGHGRGHWWVNFLQVACFSLGDSRRAFWFLGVSGPAARFPATLAPLRKQ